MSDELEVILLGTALSTFGGLAYIVGTKLARSADDDGLSWSARFKLGVLRIWGLMFLCVGIACIGGGLLDAVL